MGLFLLALLATSAYERYQVDNETTCIGPSDKVFDKADSWSADGFDFEVKGARAQVRAAGAQKEARIGLLSAIKDFSLETKTNLEQFITAFRKAGVSAIVVDGDSAYGVGDQDSTLAELFTWLGAQGMPVYAIIGNSESRSSFNRALLAAYRKHPNVINLDLVRRVDSDGFTLVSLPRYSDQRSIHESAGCRYKPEDAQELARIARGSAQPVVLVTHGPPKQAGKAALDVTTDGHNVGDPNL